MSMAGQPTGQPGLVAKPNGHPQTGGSMGYATSRPQNKIQYKYQCMVTGEKRMAPCSGCKNQKGCLAKTLQHKEQ